jgi:hypothetical protein
MSIAFSIPQSRDEALAILGERRRKKLGYKTELYVSAGGTPQLIHHNTAIVTWLPDGSAQLSNGGYWSRTTKERMSRALPPGYWLRIQKGEWFLCQKGKEIPYSNYMVVPCLSVPTTGGVE